MYTHTHTYMAVVIDAGYNKVKCFDSAVGMDALLMVPESQVRVYCSCIYTIAHKCM